MNRRPDRETGILAGLTLLALALAAVPALTWPLSPDEAGFLLVAEQWAPRPGSLYGDLWVDRPPVLLATYAAASAIMGDYGVRVVVAVLTVVGVVVAHRVGTLLGGHRGGRWAAATMVVVSGWPQLAAWAGKSESLGVPFVLLSCWLVLESTRRRGGQALALATAGGLAAAVAVGMKQSLVGGVVFTAALLLTHLATGHLVRRLVVARIAAAAGGFLVPTAVVLAWGWSVGVEPEIFWEALYGFRAEALDIIVAAESEAPRERALRLLLVAALSGIAFHLLWFLRLLPALLRQAPEATVALTALVLVDTVGLALGGSYWAAYLQGLVPATVLAAAMTASQAGARGRVSRTVTAVAVLPLVGALAVGAVPRSGAEGAAAGVHAGRAVADVARPDDTIVTLYGSPQVVWASGLTPAYRHLWSLPTRTLDPRLDRLHALLTSDRPPDWVVQLGPVGVWGLDPDGRIRAALAERYGKPTVVCGTAIRRLRGIERPPLPPVDCSRPATRWGD